MKQNIESSMKKQKVIIVGAGASGLGVAVVLKKLGIDYVYLERDEIGSSFKKWPAESKFISPSFTGNFFKMPDLNAITPDTSPAYNFQSEHPNGKDFAEYLGLIVELYELEVETGITVNGVRKVDDTLVLETNNGIYEGRYVIWAAGEFQYPRKDSFDGDELCVHFSEVASFSDLAGEERIVIGAYESGFDAAINLIQLGKDVTLLDGENYLELINSDSSYSLTPYTRDRIEKIHDQLTYHKETRVAKVELNGSEYVVTTEDNKRFVSNNKPLNCTGFDTSISLVKELFEDNDGYPLLNEFDESTITENLFLVGPQVKHENALFCFIYKFRQRFAIVAQEIAQREQVSDEVLENVIWEYESQNFYLDDLSCCDNECVC